ncbi:MAG: zinc-binding dehydrogenase, partial [Actinomycetota bacterium]
LPLTDVMGTGHHANVLGRVRPGATVAVVGDGAVGLCAVLGAARLGAERILALGHHDERLQIATSFGATEVLTSSGDELIESVHESTDGGAECVLECVGNQGAMETAVAIARPSGTVSFVGVPAEVDTVDAMRLFQNNIALNGGVAPVRAYLPELLADAVAGTLDPSPVLDLTVDLDGVPDGYAAMDERRTVKVMVAP